MSTEYFTQQLGNAHSFLQLRELDHILGHKASLNLNKFKKIKKKTCIISNHSGYQIISNQ
jgi:hypothetical protein